LKANAKIENDFFRTENQEKGDRTDWVNEKRSQNVKKLHSLAISFFSTLVVVSQSSSPAIAWIDGRVGKVGKVGKVVRPANDWWFIEIKNECTSGKGFRGKTSLHCNTVGPQKHFDIKKKGNKLKGKVN
jgi:hypothetical protein